MSMQTDIDFLKEFREDLLLSACESVVLRCKNITKSQLPKAVLIPNCCFLCSVGNQESPRVVSGAILISY